MGRGIYVGDNFLGLYNKTYPKTDSMGCEPGSQEYVHKR